METTSLGGKKKWLWLILYNYYFQIFTVVITWLEQQYSINWQSCLSVLYLLFSSLLFTPAADIRIIQENKNEKERIQRVNREAFGDGPQPKLEFAQYKVVKATNLGVFYCFNVVVATWNCKLKKY